MAFPKAAWGIEIGANAIKAMRLERDGEGVTVSDFAVIPHKKVLTTPDLDQDEMIRLSLGQFVSQKSLENEHLVVGVPGHAAFARFAKLPPVEPKKVPDIVKFEAVQQIPFPIDEVEWDYQTFTADDSPEVEVGIFAITRERVQKRLGLYAELNMTPEALTLSPVAVYNAMAFDHDLAAAKGPVIFLDIGTQATDVIVAEEGRCWIRTFPLGGTHFTEAIATAFKLSYSKAEKLKKEAATSKYAKQIMQAMRPVFSDLLQDLQRSIGYYNSMHRDNQLVNMVGLGSTFKIPGLRKFLGQQLQINVVRLDEFKKLTVGGREAAAFSEHTVNMATVYGLALQGIGLAQISANLVPVKALRDQMWHSKTKWFAAAAAIVIAGAGMTLYRPLTDRAALEPGSGPSEVQQVINQAQQIRTEYDNIKASSDIGHTAENVRQLFDHRTVWPHLVTDVAAALNSTNPQPVLFTGNELQILAIDPAQRRLVQLEELSGEYYPPASNNGPRRIAVTMNVQLSHEAPNNFLNDTVAQWLRDNAERPGVPYRILVDTISHNPTQRQTILVTEAGESAEGTPSGGGGVTKPPSGGSRQPPRGQRPPSGPGGSGTGAGGGTPPSGTGFGAGAGGGRGRRQPPSSGRQAPGSGLGGPGQSGSSGAAPPVTRPPSGSPGTTGGGLPQLPPSGPPTGGSGYGAITQPSDLNEMAPLPAKPKFYPAGSKYYLVPITFQIEILDDKAGPQADQTAGLTPDQEDATS